MNIQIFGTKKSFDTKKAQRYFKERRIKFQFIESTACTPRLLRSSASVAMSALTVRPRDARIAARKVAR